MKTKLSSLKLIFRIKYNQSIGISRTKLQKKTMKGYISFNKKIEKYKLDLLTIINDNYDSPNDWSVLIESIKSFVKGEKKEYYETIKITRLIDSFIKERKPEYKPGTIRKYEILKTLISHFEGKHNILLYSNVVNYENIEKFRQYVLYERDNRSSSSFVEQFCCQNQKRDRLSHYCP